MNARHLLHAAAGTNPVLVIEIDIPHRPAPINVTAVMTFIQRAPFREREGEEGLDTLDPTGLGLWLNAERNRRTSKETSAALRFINQPADVG